MGFHLDNTTTPEVFNYIPVIMPFLHIMKGIKIIFLRKLKNIVIPPTLKDTASFKLGNNDYKIIVKLNTLEKLYTSLVEHDSKWVAL